MEQVYLTLGAVINNQEHYIKEWLSFYHLMGVERFCIAFHNCTDETLQRVKELPFADRIHTYNVRSELSRVQMGVYRKIHELFGASTKWMLYIDSDEFMFPKTHSTLKEFLEQYEEFSSVSIHQRQFGHSNQMTRPNGLSIEAFVWASNIAGHADDRVIKTVFQPQYLLDFFSPHFQMCHTLPQVRTNKEGFQFIGSYASVQSPLQDVAQYNHYYTRSMEDWLARHFRGSCNDPRQNSFYDVYDFTYRGRTAVINEDILRFAVPLRELMGIPHYDITPSGVKVITFADEADEESTAYNVVRSGKRRGINIVPTVINSEAYNSPVSQHLYYLHDVVKQELEKGTKYLLYAAGKLSVFLESMDVICNKLQTMYNGQVLCSGSGNVPYLSGTEFMLHLVSRHKANGILCPYLLFGEPAILDKLLTGLEEVHRRLTTNSPVTETEKFVLRAESIKTQIEEHQKNGTTPHPFDSIEFLWNIYQANTENQELVYPDLNRRLFSHVTHVPDYWLNQRHAIALGDSNVRLGAACAAVMESSDPKKLNRWLRTCDVRGEQPRRRSHEQAKEELWAVWDEPELMSRAEADITTYRTGVFTFRIVDSQNNPVINTPVKITLKRHEFGFGLQHLRFGQYDTEDANRRYEQWAAQTLNQTTAHVCWTDIEPDKGRFVSGNLNRTLDNAAKYGMKTLGHCLFWDHWQWFRPKWLPSTTNHDEYMALWRNYIDNVAEQCGNKITSWHVINEAFLKEDGNLEERIIVQDGFYKAFDYAKQKVQGDLGACFCQDVFHNIYNYGEDAHEVKIVRDLLDRQAKLDFVGLQYHSYDPRWGQEVLNPESIRETAELFGSYGLYLTLAELGVFYSENVNNPQLRDGWHDPVLQAMLVKNIYKFFFSLPQIRSITYWEEFKKSHPQGDRNVFMNMLADDKFMPYLAHTELTALINEEWSTKESKETDYEGTAAFRCFFGDYNVEVSAPGGVKSFDVSCRSGSDKTLTVTI